MVAHLAKGFKQGAESFLVRVKRAQFPRMMG